MVVGAKVCDLTEDLLWFVCGLYVGILTSSLTKTSLTNLGCVSLLPIGPATRCDEMDHYPAIMSF